MLAVQLMNPMAAAAAALFRNAEGNAQKAGRYAQVPAATIAKTKMRSALECGNTNQAPSATAAANCGIAKCQRRSLVRSEFQPTNSIATKAAPKMSAPNQLTRETLHAVNRCSIVGS